MPPLLVTEDMKKKKTKVSFFRFRHFRPKKHTGFSRQKTSSHKMRFF